jgi:hypothetical protein
MGRPGLPPGIYFRLLLIGYFEGIDSERGIAWRAADSLALRDFLGLELHDVPPECLGHAGLIKGKTIGLDATTLEANAALRSVVRRDTGEGYEDSLTRLAKASGIGTPTRADLARLDRKRKKKGSNHEWTHPRDPDAKITKMKDGRTHLAHKAEHAIDLETGAIVGVTVQGADQGDTTTMQMTPSSRSRKSSPTRAITAEGPSTIWRRSRFGPTSASLTADHNRGSIKPTVPASRRADPTIESPYTMGVRGVVQLVYPPCATHAG